MILEYFSVFVAGRGRITALSTATIALAVLAGFRLNTELKRAADLSARQLQVREKIDNEYQGMRIVEYYSASSKTYALKFASGYSGNLFGGQLQRLYPNSCFYSPWEFQFSNFAGRISPKEIAPAGTWFVLHGYSFADSDFRVFLPEPPLPSNVVIENVYGGDSDKPGELDGEAIYRARFTSD